MIPMAAFLWFLLLSVPVGILQDRFGKRNILNIGMVVTALGMLLPYLIYSFPVVLAGFALLGIGNTIVQVSANPLLVDVVPDSKRSSFLSFSQFVKAIGSMVAPYLAAYIALQWGDWKLMFLVFSIVSILTVIWLAAIPIEESKPERARASMVSAFKLLGNNFILKMVLCIFLVVGIDVGVNAVSGQFFQNKLGLDLEAASYARSVYFFGKMLGTFLGAFLLAVLSSVRFLRFTSVLGLLALIALVFAPDKTSAFIIMFLAGLGIANIFPLVFSLTIGRYPDRSNEISGLMIMAVSGGAFIPPLIGWLFDISGITAGMLVLVACAIYILVVSMLYREKN